MTGASRTCGLRRCNAANRRAVPEMSRWGTHRRPRSAPAFAAPATWRSLPARLSRVRTLGKLSLFLGFHHSSHAEYLRDTAEIQRRDRGEVRWWDVAARRTEPEARSRRDRDEISRGVGDDAILLGRSAPQRVDVLGVAEEHENAGGALKGILVHGNASLKRESDLRRDARRGTSRDMRLRQRRNDVGVRQQRADALE